MIFFLQKKNEINFFIYVGERTNLPRCWLAHTAGYAGLA